MKKAFVTILICLTVFVLSACCLSHDWQEATCVAPKTCVKCGETEGEPLGHMWVDATCTEPKTCSVCGETEGEPLGHMWVDATCTEPRTCSVCGETEGEPLGHMWIDATYHEPKTCSVCGETEGTVKKSFCEQNSVTVSSSLTNVRINACAVNRMNDPSQIEFPITKISFKSHTILPSEREGYVTVKLSFTGRFLLPSFTNYYMTPGEGLFDYYTGYMLSERSTYNDDTYELFDTVYIDDMVYRIYYSRDIEWLSSYQWSSTDNSYYAEYESSYTIDVPKDYDGLIIGLFSDKEWIPYEEAEDIISGYIDPSEEGFYFWLSR